MTRQEFRELCQNGPVILDGATGTNLMKAGMPSGVCMEQWALEHKDCLLAFQKEFVEAGTQILYASTFTGSRLKLAAYGLENEVDRINRELVQVSREAAGGKALVAGDMTMTGKQLYPYGELQFEELVDVYREQAKALYEAGVDLFIVESMMSLQETRAAVIAIREVCDLPLMASLTFAEEGRTLFGNTPEAAIVALQGLGVDAVGLNCTTGPEGMLENLRRMLPYAKVPVLAKPNAGLPVIVNGEVEYPTPPEEFAAGAKKLVEAGAALIGGCCGTTPEYIRDLTEAVKTVQPEDKEPKAAPLEGIASEWDALQITEEEPPVIGEAIDVDTNEELREELSEGDVDTLLDLVEDQEDEDAQVLNIYIDAEEIDGKEMIRTILEELGQTSRSMLCFDSSDPETLETALRLYPGRAMVNTARWSEETAEKMAPVIEKYGPLLRRGPQVRR